MKVILSFEKISNLEIIWRGGESLPDYLVKLGDLSTFVGSNKILGYYETDMIFLKWVCQKERFELIVRVG